MSKAKLYFFILSVTIPFLGFAQMNSSLEWKKIFAKYHVEGTFILKDISNGTVNIFNHKRADSLFVPASTFKILNSLIALQTSAISAINDTIKWDGKDKGWTAWNKDQTMKSAIQVSCIWFYQELAKRIGSEKMHNWIEKCNYGNKKMGVQLTNFWLEGDLKISAKQQVDFLEDLVNNELPFDQQIQEAVKQIMITDSTDQYIMHSKTGWVDTIGWNVGFVEAENKIWVFAMNINIEDQEDTQYRRKITYDILRSERILH